MSRNIWIALAVVIALGAAGWFMQRDGVPPEQMTVAPQPQPEPAPQPVIRDEPPPIEQTTTTPENKVQLPSLNESDASARAAAGQLSQKMAAWMAPEEQIRKWVVAVDLAADGKLMEKNRPLGYPLGQFKVSGSDNDYRPELSNLGRTTELVDAVTAIPPEQAVALYRLWRPLFDEAYKELGKPGSFDARLKQAIDNALAVKPLPGTPTLVRPKIYYRYADPKLEAASDLEKLMWRIGPDNSAKLQGWLASMRDAL